MKRVKFHFLVIAIFILFLNGHTSAQTNFNGGLGLIYVQSAWTVEPGFLSIGSHSRFFGKNANYVDRTPLTVWDVSGRLNFNYGLGKHVEVSATPVIYQDTNLSGDKVSSPDDLFLAAKFGSFAATGSSVSYGLLASARFPLGKASNVPFEPYSSSNVGWGVTGLMSYSMDPLYPTDATNIHFNLGYWNHNDVGAGLVENGTIGTLPTKMTQELKYGFGVKVPKNSIDFSFEIYGNAFLQAPPTSAYSRESYLYLTPAVYYSPMNWVTLNAGIDIRLFNSKDKTLYADDGSGAVRTLPNEQPNYPGWRLVFGTSFNILPTSSYRLSERDLLMQKAQSRRELFEQIIREQNETESAEAELERIRAERIRAEKELERLRKILEEDAEDSEKNPE